MKSLKFLAIAILVIGGAVLVYRLATPSEVIGETSAPTNTNASTSNLGQLVDDFDDPSANSLGHPRQFINDTVAGGQTKMEHSIEGGVLSVKGEIVPPRGQPGWGSIVLLLDAQGGPQDASTYQGIRLKLRINTGMLSVSANSSEITNFDYHAAQVTKQPGSEFQEVSIPFDEMKRAWSGQTTLNKSTLTSISLTTFAVQKQAFDFEVDSVSFY